MADSFEVIVGNQKTTHTDPKEAGAEFFAADSSMRPVVIHAMSSEHSPGGVGRIMAETEVHGLDANGKKRYVKRLPNSHNVDGKFCDGFYAAQEKAKNQE